MCFPLFDVFNRRSIEEINRLLRKGMSNHLLLRKTDVLKTSIFSKRKYEEIQ